jgi:hypothetical protein
MAEEEINNMIISMNIAMGYNMIGVDLYNNSWRSIKLPPAIKKVKQETTKDIYINPIVVSYINKLKEHNLYDENHYIVKSLLANIDKKNIDNRNISYWESIIMKLIVDNKKNI